MAPLSTLVILSAVLVTAFISGIFGLAGGLILMAVLTALLPLATAMIVHGAVQMVSNGYRAFRLRRHIHWPVLARYALGAAIAAALLFPLAWRPDRQAVYLLISSIAIFVWIPRSWAEFDARKPFQAEIAGLLAQSLSMLAGIAGPLVQLFFVRTDLSRQAIVSTEATTQTLSHLVKIAFWSVPVVAAAGWSAMPPLWLLAAAIPLSMLGTTLGGKVLDAMSDVNFKAWMKWLVTAVCGVMLMRAAGWL
ncbi:TSUP family transporter [Hyphomonas sp.]|uniref:TSUP family transporter n=1 Tax=Hyphomonas sp. TaxID=87 RepID=UPI0039199E3D